MAASSGDDVSLVSGLTESQADVVDAVLAASRVFVAVAANALAGLTPEVTLPQFRTLVLLDQHGTMTVAQLAESLGVVPSTATRMCDRLVAKRLVRRTVDAHDRRRLALSLSPAGQDLIAESTRRRRQQIAKLLRSVPVDERARLADALGLLVAAAR